MEIDNSNLIVCINKFCSSSEDKIDTIDLSELEKLSYSAIMRELVRIGNREIIKSFLSIYKQIFEKMILVGDDAVPDKALPITIMIFSQLYPIKFSENIKGS